MRNLRRDLTWIGLAYVAYLVVSALSQTGTAMITSWLIPWIGHDAWMVLCIIFMYPLALFLYWLILQMVPKARQNWTYPMGVGRFLGWFVICMGGVYFGSLIGQFLMTIVSVITGETMVNQVEEMIMDMSLWAVIVSAVILAPIMEELIFRKLVLDRLAGYGPAVAMSVSALVFGLAHGNFYQFFYAFLLGLIFAYIYLRTGKVRYSMMLHMMVNFCGSVIPILLLRVADENEVAAILASVTQLTFMGVFMLGGLILFICKWKEIKTYVHGNTVRGWRRYLITSPGMILLYVCCVVLFFL